jgi:hypothetical protein
MLSLGMYQTVDKNPTECETVGQLLCAKIVRTYQICQVRTSFAYEVLI